MNRNRPSVAADRNRHEASSSTVIADKEDFISGTDASELTNDAKAAS